MIPINEVLNLMRRRGIGDAVLSRVETLNPGGVEEGTIPRGFRRTLTIRSACWEMNIISRREFIARVGHKAYRALPRRDFISLGGKRRAVRGCAGTTDRF